MLLVRMDSHFEFIQFLVNFAHEMVHTHTMKPFIFGYYHIITGTIMMSGCGILTNGKGTRREYGEFNLDELSVSIKITFWCTILFLDIEIYSKTCDEGTFKKCVYITGVLFRRFISMLKYNFIHRKCHLDTQKVSPHHRFTVSDMIGCPSCMCLG